MPFHRPLRHVDPTRPRSWVHRAYVRAIDTRPVAWFSKHVGWKVDPVLLRLTGGRLGFGLMIPTALLETRGARTGRVRRNVVIYFHDGDRITLVASNLGLSHHPAWLHNVRAHPDVRLAARPHRVEEVRDESELARLWGLAAGFFPPYAKYRDRAAAAGRTIPVVQLTPR